MERKTEGWTSIDIPTTERTIMLADMDTHTRMGNIMTMAAATAIRMTTVKEGTGTPTE